MAAGDDVPVFWAIWLQFPLQHALHSPLLPYAGGKFISRPYLRLRHDVCLRRRSNDSLRLLRQFTISWSSLHHNVGVCLGATKPIRENEFLRITDVPGAVPAMGVAWVLPSPWQLYLC